MSKNVLELVKNYKKTIKNLKSKKKPSVTKNFQSSFLCKTNLTLAKVDFLGQNRKNCHE